VPLQLRFGEGGLLVAQILLLLLPAVLFVRLGGFDPVETLSLRLPTRRQVAGGALAMTGGVQLAWILAWLQGLFTPVPVDFLEAMAEMLRADSPGRFLWLLLLAALTPAIAEELLFRGVLLSAFRRSLPTLWAVVGVGLVFGLFHLSPQTAFRILPTAWLGILLAWIVVASGSLPLAIALHFVNNGVILALASHPLTRERASSADQEPSLLLLPLGLGLLAWGITLLHGEREERGRGSLAAAPEAPG
jgi:sodium transport system permease protein